jgi:geranylgeranyl diphosphate synthase, type II
MSDELSLWLDRRRSDLDAALDAALPRSPDCPAHLADAMSYSLLAGGKRLRPLLCVAACDAVGGDYRVALPAACALEFIHTYSLVHDDLPAMDNDRLRRGKPTLHVVAGEAMAILAGDGLLTEAFAILARIPAGSVPTARALQVVEVIARAAGACGMVGGQALDVAGLAGPADQGQDALARGLAVMHAKKTGALIRASAVAGALMGGADDSTVDAIDRAAAEFGLGFQIVDDVLDVEGDSSGIGKTAGKDAAAGKLTYPSIYGVERSKQMAGECLEKAVAILRPLPLRSPHLLALGRAMIERRR